MDHLNTSNTLFDDLDPTSARSPETFAGMLRDVRQRAGRTYADLCKSTKRADRPLTQGTLSAIFSGKQLPTVGQAGQILTGCGLAEPQVARWIKVLADLRGQADRTDSARTRAVLGAVEEAEQRADDLAARRAELTTLLAVEEAKCRNLERELGQLRKRPDQARGVGELELLLRRERAYNDELIGELVTTTGDLAALTTSSPHGCGLDLPGRGRRCPLPAVDRIFVGRDSLLDAIGAPGLLWLSGRPGVGTSQVAIHLAHRVAATHDRALYINLRGMSPGHQLSAREAAHDLLDALTGSPWSRHVDEAALYERLQTVLAAADVLLVLDNARDAAHVAPLLRVTGTSTVVVTSRQRTQDFTNTAIHVPVLARTEAVTLLARFAPTADSAVLERIAELCDDLPLALRIVASLIVGRPELIPTVARSLEAEQERLNYLSSPERTVRSAVLLSYHNLAPDVQLAARYLAISFAAVSDIAEMAYGRDSGEAPTALQLHRVVDASLAEYSVTDDDVLIFSVAPLIRLVLVECSAREDEPAAIATFQARTARHMANTLAAVVERQDIVVDTTRARTGLSAASAHQWWDIAEDLARSLIHLHDGLGDLRTLAEVTDILVSAHLANGKPDCAVDAALEIAGTLRLSAAHRVDALAWVQRAAKIAQVHQLPTREVKARMTTSQIAVQLADTETALHAARATLPLLESALTEGEAINPLINIGKLHLFCEQFSEAERYLRRAAEFAERAGDVRNRAASEFALAQSLGGLNRAAEAKLAYKKASILYVATGESDNAAVAQENIADLCDDLHDEVAARAQAVGHWRETADHGRLAAALVNLSALSCSTGRLDVATAALIEADGCALEDRYDLAHEITVRLAALARLRKQPLDPPPDRPGAHELIIRACRSISVSGDTEQLTTLLSHPVLNPDASYDFWLFDGPRTPDNPTALEG
ncbi:NB-ARC domain-containing protein [Amycolatopsis sp. Hca4]|uniref:NB-ARC domain-containing protein n=1 Tax=Amycolatopsis sp. Hca4 TaxID=2742131 RepID=UPI00158FB996|nr:NB-ARC domain-containing protein [Amycolatopsis sp. Hca4]QKV74136.1 hypothetical protein HUT10_10430 [Amycolatopsis sp. Hca4]